MATKKIVFMGTPHYADRILQTLIDAEDMAVTLVITQPDRPVGRKRVMTPPPVKQTAEANGIGVLQPQRLSEAGIAEHIASLSPDFIVVAAFGQLLPKSILDIAPCINLHASLLPKYRGASPIQQALLNGDKVTGVTSMLMDEGLDTGAILLKKRFEIPEDMRLHTLTEQLTEDACALTLETIRRFDKITPEPQNDAEASYCKKIRKSDGLIAFEDAANIYNKYRAFEGWPGIFDTNGTKYEDVKLEAKEGSYKAGDILAIYDDESLSIGCERGRLRVGILQPPGKKPMRAKAYCVGRGKRVGDTIF